MVCGLLMPPQKSTCVKYRVIYSLRFKSTHDAVRCKYFLQFFISHKSQSVGSYKTLSLIRHSMMSSINLLYITNQKLCPKTKMPVVVCAELSQFLSITCSNRGHSFSGIDLTFLSSIFALPRCSSCFSPDSCSPSNTQQSSFLYHDCFSM